MDKLRVDIPIIVEGRYDKIKLDSILDARIIVTDGFGIFNAAEKRALLRALAEKHGVIILTDSDGAGLLIRSHLRSALPPDKVINLYIPQIEGREKRKSAPSKEGLLGVEGIDADVLRSLFAPFAAGNTPVGADAAELVTKADFYADGLSGGAGSAAKRAALAHALSLPCNMSANALLEAINLLYTRDEYRRFADDIDLITKRKESGDAAHKNEERN